jgi:hypothetical protein
MTRMTRPYRPAPRVLAPIRRCARKQAPISLQPPFLHDERFHPMNSDVLRRLPSFFWRSVVATFTLTTLPLPRVHASPKATLPSWAMMPPPISPNSARWGRPGGLNHSRRGSAQRYRCPKTTSTCRSLGAQPAERNRSGAPPSDFIGRPRATGSRRAKGNARPHQDRRDANRARVKVPGQGNERMAASHRNLTQPRSHIDRLPRSRIGHYPLAGFFGTTG